MTWRKTGCEFDDEIAEAGLSDSAYRTHSEAIGWLYRVEQTSLRIPKNLVRRFAGSPDYDPAIEELVKASFWRDRGDAWEIAHHADVIRESIHQQRRVREKNKRGQRAWRNRQSGSQPAGSKVIADVTDYVTHYADSQTDSFPSHTTNGVKNADPAVTK